MSILIKLFGPLCDVVGKSQLQMEGFSDTNGVTEKILSDFPELKKHQFIVAVGKQLIKTNTDLRPGDVVALLPPFAGG